MAQIKFGDEERIVMVEKAPDRSKALRKCCCCCLSCAFAPVKTMWGIGGLLAIVLLIGLAIATGFLATARANAMAVADSALATVNEWKTAATAFFTSSTQERLWRRTFVAGAPADPWSNAAILATGWVEFQADSVTINITAAARSVVQVVLVGRAATGGPAYNITSAPVGYSPALPAPGILAAWLRGDLLYLALLKWDGGLQQSILLPMN